RHECLGEDKGVLYMAIHRFGPVSLAFILALLGLGLALTALGQADSPSKRVSEPLPQAPDGLQVRAVAPFTPQDQEPVRIAAHPQTGRLYGLGGGGDIYLLDVESQSKRRVWSGADYIDQPKRQGVNIPLPIDAQWVNSPITLRATLCLGLGFDRDG